MEFIIARLLKGSKGEVVGADFYSGIRYLPNGAPDGLLWTVERDEAYPFPNRDFAANFLGGESQRMANCVIQQRASEPQ